MNNSKELFYDSISDKFDQIMNMYDTQRRIEVIFDEFLKHQSIDHLSLLDGGCGTGFFTSAARARNAHVIPLDISPKLVKKTLQKNSLNKGICGSLLELPFKSNTFDIVISSDVIEHTCDPYTSTKELIRVLKPNGLLCLTVPNRTTWYFSLILANILGLRPYKGYENWVPYFAFKHFIRTQNMTILDYKGIHLFPFVIKRLRPILRKMDSMLSHKLGFLFVNIALFARKS